MSTMQRFFPRGLNEKGLGQGAPLSPDLVGHVREKRIRSISLLCGCRGGLSGSPIPGFYGYPSLIPIRSEP
jgi:hypothetical protein